MGKDIGGKTRSRRIGYHCCRYICLLHAFIDPLKNTVLHYIYSEKASITLSCDPCTVSKGEATRVSVEVAPRPSVDIAEGVLKLQFNERELTLSEETAASFETNVITAKRLLNKSFVLYPTSNVESAATSVVTVTLQTKFGNHVSGPMRIDRKSVV